MTEQTLPGLLKNTDTLRIGNYAKYLQYYAGQLPEPERQVTRWSRGVTLNYLKVFIDKATSYLMADMSFTINQSDRPEAAAVAEAALRKCYLDNNLDLLDLETETDCAILGDACYKVIWDQAAGRVRVTAPDVQGLWAWTRGDDINEVSRVATRYILQPDALLKLHGYSSQTPQEVIEDWTPEVFDLWIAGQLLRSQPNPYGFIPFVIYPNVRQPKSIWGASDIAALLNVQVEINRAVTQLSRILELSGNPIAVLENVEKSHDIAVQPGAVWEIPEDGGPDTVDWAQFQQHAGGTSPFSLERFFRWRCWFDYGTGLSGDLMSHEYDAVNMVLGLGIPKSVVASGGIYYFKDGRDVPDVFQAVCEYPDRDLTFMYSATLANGNYRGLQFMGHDGTMRLAGSLDVVPDNESTRYETKLEEGILSPDRSMFTYRPGFKGIDAVTSATAEYFASRGLLYTYRGGRRVSAYHLHIGEWLDAIRNGGPTSCDIEQGFQEAITCHMATRSFQEGRKVEWDPVAMRIV